MKELMREWSNNKALMQEINVSMNDWNSEVSWT